MMSADRNACCQRIDSTGVCYGGEYLNAEKLLYSPSTINIRSVLRIPIPILLLVSIAFPLLLSSTIGFNSMRSIAAWFYGWSGVIIFDVGFPRHFVWEVYALLATWLIGRLFVHDLRQAAIRIAQSAHRDFVEKSPQQSQSSQSSAEHQLKSSADTLSNRLTDLLSAKDSSSVASTLYVFFGFEALICHYYFLNDSSYFITSIFFYILYIAFYLRIFTLFKKADLTTIKLSTDYLNATSFWYYFLFSDFPAIIVLRASAVVLSLSLLCYYISMIDNNTVLQVKLVICGVIWMQVVFSNILTGVVSSGGHKYMYAHFLKNAVYYSPGCKGRS
jgi:hypothetical protein